MKKIFQFTLILAVVFPVFAFAQIAEPIQSTDLGSSEQGGTGGPTPEMIAEMKKQQADQAKLLPPPPAPNIDSSADASVPPSNIEDKVGMLSYSVTLIFIWLIGITAFMLKGAKK